MIVIGVDTAGQARTSTAWCSACRADIRGATYAGPTGALNAIRDAERLKAKHQRWHETQDAAAADPFEGITT